MLILLEMCIPNREITKGRERARERKVRVIKRKKEEVK
jgi:hypothetical protein